MSENIKKLIRHISRIRDYEEGKIIMVKDEVTYTLEEIQKTLFALNEEFYDLKLSQNKVIRN